MTGSERPTPPAETAVRSWRAVASPAEGVRKEEAEMAVASAKAAMMVWRRRWAVARVKEGGVPRRWWLKREMGRRQRSS